MNFNFVFGKQHKHIFLVNDISLMNDEMYVEKRMGKREIVSFDKILKRIKKLGQEANIKINYTTLVMKVIDQLYDGISTTKIDELEKKINSMQSSMLTILPTVTKNTSDNDKNKQAILAIIANKDKT